jgi:hypothetical protein
LGNWKGAEKDLRFHGIWGLVWHDLLVRCRCQSQVGVPIILESRRWAEGKKQQQN